MKGIETIKAGLKELKADAVKFVKENKTDLAIMGLCLVGISTGGKLVRRGVDKGNTKTAVTGAALVAGSATFYGMACRDLMD